MQKPTLIAFAAAAVLMAALLAIPAVRTYLGANVGLVVTVISPQHAAELVTERARIGSADLKRDGRIDVLDIATWITGRRIFVEGRTLAGYADVDITNDGIVDVEDLAYVIATYGKRVPQEAL